MNDRADPNNRMRIQQISGKTIDATKAFYVIKSDVFGPMGHELIPFESEADAKAFKKDHFGLKVLSFKELTEIEVNKLDTYE